jgi:hypothetical protein
MLLGIVILFVCILALGTLLEMQRSRDRPRERKPKRDGDSDTASTDERSDGSTRPRT